MKKSIAVLLAVLIMLSLAACAGNSSPAASTSPQSPAEASAPPAEADPAPSANPAPAADPGEVATGTVGYYTDAVDHQARKTYEICYALPTVSPMHDGFIKALEKFTKTANFNFTTATADNDPEAFLQNLEIMLTKGYDGFIVDSGGQVAARVIEIMNESGIPWLAWITPMYDDNDELGGPCVTVLDQDTGRIQAEWVIENYKSYYGDIDPKEIGVIGYTLTTAPTLHSRLTSALEVFKAAFPENDLFFEVDMANKQMTTDAAYSETTTIFSTQPQIKYWWIVTPFEFIAQGSARATEAMDKEASVLITSAAIDTLMIEWESGYEGSWAASLGISTYEAAAPEIYGLIALIDGRATTETLWAEYKQPGDKYTLLNVNTQMVTKQTYSRYLDGILAKYGITE